MQQLSIKELQKKANEIRQDIIKMLLEAGSGHSGGPWGMADIFTALYFRVLKHDPKKPKWADRDRLILSNGHIVPVRYVTMMHAGYIDKKHLPTLRKIGSILEGHPSVKAIPALETSSGPLGEGLSQACGMAMAAKMDGNQNKYHIWCLTSDGEHEEGMTWEAVMLAAKYKLDNLTVIIDRNYIQIDGDTESVMPLDPLAEKYKSFNWNVLETDGHDFNEIVARLEESKADRGRPTVIIARTTPGKGVSFMENDYRWHGIPPGLGPEDKVPRERQAAEALRELTEIENNLLK